MRAREGDPLKNIRLVVVDVDGCLTPGEAQPWDFSVLQFAADLNRRSRDDPNQFAVTLCTGRQEPYVEALMQAIDAHLPAIYENGGGLYFPSPYGFAENPAITSEQRARLDEIRRALTRALVEPGVCQFQPGKQVSLTLYPAQEDVTFPQLADLARRALDGKADGFSITASVTSVEILPEGIDKGVGVEWLSHETGIPLAQMAGIGNAPGDLSFLRRVGFSAAPANAVGEVKRAVQYVSPFEDGKGVENILLKWLET